jgi:hypothetical protein
MKGGALAIALLLGMLSVFSNSAQAATPWRGYDAMFSSDCVFSAAYLYRLSHEKHPPDEEVVRRELQEAGHSFGKGSMKTLVNYLVKAGHDVAVYKTSVDGLLSLNDYVIVHLMRKGIGHFVLLKYLAKTKKFVLYDTEGNGGVTEVNAKTIERSFTGYILCLRR